VSNQKRESFKPLAQSISVPPQSSSSFEEKVGTLVHHSTHSISDNIKSSDQTPCDIVNELTYFIIKKSYFFFVQNPSDIPTDSQIVSSNSMTASTQCSLPFLEGFIKCQSDEIIKSANDDAESSSDKNVSTDNIIRF
jgi:hypothetical protein